MATSSSNPRLDRAVTRLGKAANEAQGRYLADLAQRERASRILRPDEVAGDYDAGRLLTTTLGGGVERALTAEDLMVFRRNVQMLGKAYRGGITAKGIIDRSLEIDRERCNREIRVALPVQVFGGRVHFVTNAGPNSDVTRHHVHLEFMNYGAAVASPARAGELVKMLATGAIKFDCDCGRHRYWYRYVASIGRFNSGREETGFPKIRNPELRGVACKHVLRVVQQLASPLVRRYLVDMIDRGRKSAGTTLTKIDHKEIKALAEQQAKQAGWKRNQVESTVEKRDRLAQQRKVREIAKKKATTTRNLDPKKLAVERRKFEDAARRLAAAGGISQKMLQAMLAKLKK